MTFVDGEAFEIAFQSTKNVGMFVENRVQTSFVNSSQLANQELCLYCPDILPTISSPWSLAWVHGKYTYT